MSVLLSFRRIKNRFVETFVDGYRKSILSRFPSRNSAKTLSVEIFIWFIFLLFFLGRYFENANPLFFLFLCHFKQFYICMSIQWNRLMTTLRPKNWLEKIIWVYGSMVTSRKMMPRNLVGTKHSFNPIIYKWCIKNDQNINKHHLNEWKKLHQLNEKKNIKTNNTITWSHQHFYIGNIIKFKRIQSYTT